MDEAETVELARQFRSRRSADIVEGLATLLDVDARRLQRGLDAEIESKKIDPNVTKLVDSIFDRGVQLAKMVDPMLAARMSPGTKISFGYYNGGGVLGPGSAARVQASTPQELMAGVVKALAAEGISIEDATPDDVERILGTVPRGEVIDVNATDVPDAGP